MSFTKFLRTRFFTEHFQDTASGSDFISQALKDLM